MKSLIAFTKEETAATAIEYAFVLAMILMATIATVESFGTQVGNMFGSTQTEMEAHGVK